MSDYTAIFRNLRTNRVAQSPAERACAIECHRAATKLVPPVLGVLAAFVAAVLIAMEAVGRIGL